MTIDERAERIAANLLASFDGDVFWEEAGDWNTGTPDPNLVAGIAAAIREAVNEAAAEEREGCALVAERFAEVSPGAGWSAPDLAGVIAREIRNRAPHPEHPAAKENHNAQKESEGIGADSRAG